jgi:hypothetical protein
VLSTRSVVFAVATAAALLCSPTVRADDVLGARKTFAEGVRLYRKGDWEGARRLFREANAEHHAPTIVYNIGLAEEKLGHAQAAVDAYEAYIAESGNVGEFASAAAAAVALLKVHSTRLRIETTPPGARLFVDARPVSDRSPANFLVASGHHVVAAEGDGWRAERTVEALGSGDTLPVLLEPAAPVSPSAPAPAPTEAAAASPPSAPVPAPSSPRDAVSTPPPPSADDAPEEVAWGGAFAIVPIYLLPTNRTPLPGQPRCSASDCPAASIVAGALVDVGWSVTDRLEFLGRGFAGIGPDAKPSTGWWIGPGLSYQVGSKVWLGASFIGGNISTRAYGFSYGTSTVFGTMLEADLVLVKKRGGEWLAGVQPSVLVTKFHVDNTAIFFPLTFGYRAY